MPACNKTTYIAAVIHDEVLIAPLAVTQLSNKATNQRDSFRLISNTNGCGSYMAVLFFALDLLHVRRVHVARSGHWRAGVAVLFALGRRDRVPLQTGTGERKEKTIVR